MREVIAILKGAAKQLRDAEALDSFKKVNPALASRVFLAHGGIKLAEAKLHLLMAEEEEPCEKS
ncbi:hypothetical protein ES703_68476 [subsurface metagenome]